MSELKKIAIGGEMRPIHFGFSALSQWCDISGLSLNDLGNIGDNLSLSNAIALIYVGLKHGLFCLGCCWVLMLLLFVNGVMNLLWVVAITIIVLAEKMLPYEKLSSRFLGILLVGWGAYLILI